MKALLITVSILLVAFLSFSPAFAEPNEDKTNQPPAEQKLEKTKNSESSKSDDANASGDKNLIDDANKPVDANKTTEAPKAAAKDTASGNLLTNDPNAIRAKIEKFEGLSISLGQLNTEGSVEIGEWTRGRLDERLNLALASTKQVTDELKFLRELAVKEGALKTTAAIDGILLDRQQRYMGVIEELERNSERIKRRTEREERRTIDKERGNGRNRERPERSRKETQTQTQTQQ